MASYSEGGVQQATYTYNGQGERVSKQLSNSETIHYLYNAAGQLQGEYHYSNGNLTLRQSYVWLGMMPVAVVKEDIAAQTQAIFYLHVDHLSTPRVATDESGNTVWQWHSSAFGEELPEENGLTLNLRFPGQYYDVESGINYNYYRDYDPHSGSYLQSDPIGLAGGLNTYGYVSGNPVGFVDPLGLIDFAGGMVNVPVNTGQASSAAQQGGTVAAAIHDVFNRTMQDLKNRELNVSYTSCVTTACINTNFFDHGGQTLLPVIPEVGSSVNFCFSPPSANNSSCPTEVSFGLGKHLGVSFLSDKSACINLGFSENMLASPVNVYINMGDTL